MTIPHRSAFHTTRLPAVEGYCTPLSAAAGDAVAVRVASRTRTFSVEVVRWGAEPETVWSADGLAADDHPVPDRAWEQGCGWPVAFRIPTGIDWRSGFHVIRFRADGESGRWATSEAGFILRAPAGRPGHPAVIGLATNTWNAYNQWGGRCLYRGATAVSFERPLERGYLWRDADEDGYDGRITDIHGDPTHQRMIDHHDAHELPLWCASGSWWERERRFIEWADRAGFTFDYASNADLETHPAVLGDHRALLSVGHDEYWTWGMRDAVDRFVDDGGRWAIFSGNTCFWQVRIDHESSVMTGFKGSARRDDPVVGTDRAHLLTSMWSDPRIGRPETSTTGLTFSRGGYHRIGLAVPDGRGSYDVHCPEHWAFAGTGLGSGDRLGEGSYVVGYEVDGCALDPDAPADRPRPSHEDGAPDTLEILATAPARLVSITDEVCEPPVALWADVDPPGELETTAFVLFGDMSPASIARIADGHAVMATFTRGEGEVFNVGTADWAFGLDTDTQVQQVTANVLRRFGV